ncbi:MAG: dimethylarginine dimethylaminohydrolase family protein [Rhodothermales bacterium]
MPMSFGCTSMVAPIRRMLLKHSRTAFVNQEKIDREWQRLHYPAPPDFEQAVADYDAFVSLLRSFGMELLFLPPDEQATLDSLYVHDPVIVAHEGAILCNMGKHQRRSEPDAVGAFLDCLGIPIHGAITGAGRLEGGDVVWLDERTVAVGEGYRTNAEGIRQLTALLDDSVDEVIAVPLPHWHGPDDVLHLMSLISPLDHDLALVYSPLMTVPFRRRLLARGTTLVEVPEDEVATLGCNVLAVAPRQAIMAEGNPRTQALLEQAGVEVRTYPGNEISRKGEGGPTCLTRPLWRAS